MNKIDEFEKTSKIKKLIGIHIRVYVITVDLMERVHMQVWKTTTKTLGKSKL